MLPVSSLSHPKLSQDNVLINKDVLLFKNLLPLINTTLLTLNMSARQLPSEQANAKKTLLIFTSLLLTNTIFQETLISKTPTTEKKTQQERTLSSISVWTLKLVIETWTCPVQVNMTWTSIPLTRPTSSTFSVQITVKTCLCQMHIYTLALVHTTPSTIFHTKDQPFRK